MYALFYNVFCCWMVTIIGGTASRHIILYRDRWMTDRSFAFFWLFASGLWFFAGLRQVFFFFGLSDLDRWTFYLVQFFLLCHLIPAIIHVVLKVTRNVRVTKIVLGAMIPFFIGFTFFLFFDGVKEAGSSEWGSEYSVSSHTFWCFLPIFSVCVIGSVYDFIARLAGLAFGKKFRIELFCASGAIILYGIAGIFDTKGLVSDWKFLLIRGSYVLAAFISYTGYYWETEPVFLRDTKERSDL